MKMVFKLMIAIWFATPAVVAADTFDDIQQRGELIVGVSIFAPWTHLDREGNLAGHEVDIANSIATDLGVTARLEIYNFDEVFEALANGDIDMIAAGVAMTPERARRFLFSIPYFSTGMTIATGPSVTGEPNTVNDFNSPEMTVAVVEDTLAARIAARLLPEANVMSFATPEGAEGTVLVGRADAYVASIPEARIYALRHGERISLPLSEPLASSVAGFVVRNDDDRLLHFLNSWVHMRQADGFLEDRHRHYFDTLDWVVDMTPQ